MEEKLHLRKGNSVEEKPHPWKRNSAEEKFCRREITSVEEKSYLWKRNSVEAKSHPHGKLYHNGRECEGRGVAGMGFRNLLYHALHSLVG